MRRLLHKIMSKREKEKEQKKVEFTYREKKEREMIK